jgi:hypothetical protein
MPRLQHQTPRSHRPLPRSHHPVDSTASAELRHCDRTLAKLAPMIEPRVLSCVAVFAPSLRAGGTGSGVTASDGTRSPTPLHSRHSSPAHGTRARDYNTNASETVQLTSSHSHHSRSPPARDCSTNASNVTAAPLPSHSHCYHSHHLVHTPSFAPYRSHALVHTLRSFTVTHSRSTTPTALTLCSSAACGCATPPAASSPSPRSPLTASAATVPDE